MIEPPPRTLILISASGSPSVVVTCTPAILPVRASATVATGTEESVLLSTDDTEPMRSLRFTVAYPMTTVSSRKFASSSRATSTLVEFPMTTCCVLIPMQENTRVFPLASGTSMAYRPSTSVETPKVVPSTNTETPTSGCPSASLTTPLISWAESDRVANNPTISREILYVRFFIKELFWLVLVITGYFVFCLACHCPPCGNHPLRINGYAKLSISDYCICEKLS